MISPPYLFSVAVTSLTADRKTSTRGGLPGDKGGGGVPLCAYPVGYLQTLAQTGPGKHFLLCGPVRGNRALEPGYLLYRPGLNILPITVDNHGRCLYSGH